MNEDEANTDAAAGAANDEANDDAASNGGDAAANGADEPKGVTLTASEVAQLRAAQAKLAELEADRAAAEEAEAAKRGEFKGLLEKTKAELAELRADAARKTSDLGMIEVHEGYRSAEARTVVRALWSAMPESDREDTPEAQAARWAKAPAKAPVAVRSYLSPASTQVSTGTRSTSNANSGADEKAALQWAKSQGLIVGDLSDVTPARAAAMVNVYAKHKAKSG